MTTTVAPSFPAGVAPSSQVETTAVRLQPSTFNLPLGYLRVFVTLLVVAVHSWVAYDTFGLQHARSLLTRPRWWMLIPVDDPAQWAGFTPVILLTDQCVMALFFFVSGLFVWKSLQRKGAGVYLKARLLRLGVPFAAIFLMAPGYYYASYLQGGMTDGFWHEWLALGNWPTGHGWFLWTLLAFDLVAIAIFRAMPQPFERLGRRMNGWNSARAVTGLLILACSVVFLPLTVRYGVLDAFSFGPFQISKGMCLLYLAYFLTGILVGLNGVDGSTGTADQTGRNRTLQQLEEHWLAWLVSAIGGTLAWCGTIYLSHRHGHPGFWNIAQGIGFEVSCALNSFAILGFFLHFIRRPRRWLNSLLACAYGIYVVHCLIVPWLQYGLLGVSVPAWVKGPVVFLVAMGVSWITIHVARKSKLVARIL